MRRHRRLGAALAAAVVVAALVPAVRHVLASGPSGAQLPDFNASTPITETMPKQWGLQVTTGGLNGGDKVTLAFLYNGKPGDRTHAVAFNYLDPTDVAGSILVWNVSPVPLPTALPTALPPGAGSPQCTAAGTPSGFSNMEVDPFAQTITLTMQAAIPANSVIVFCFTSHLLVSFPIAVGGGYSIRYTEPGGSTDTPPYTVQPQSSTTTLTQVLDTDGSDQTNTGLGGSRPLVYSTTYKLSLRGAAGEHYSATSKAYDASSQIADNSASVSIVGTSNGVGCQGDKYGTLCADQSGTATGTVTVTSTNVRPDYVVISSGGNTDTVPNMITISAGPSGASPPAAQPTPTPLPPGATPTPTQPFDANCPLNRSLSTTPGIGAHDVLDAAQQALFPTATRICAPLASSLSFVGTNDGAGIAQGLDDCYSPYAFVGTDRALTSTEYNGVPTCDRGVSQFPVLIEPVVVTYNLDAPGCQVGTVNLRNTLLGEIFLGTITHWNDPQLSVDNPGLGKCNLPILVAHDIGPATLVFKDYLGKRTPVFAGEAQPQLADVWPGQSPVSCTANGSPAMALCVEGQPGMIGYGYYKSINAAGLPLAAVDDPSGTFQSQPLDPTTGCVQAATNNPTIPTATSSDWSNESLADVMPLAYPICAFDFVISPIRCHRGIGYSGLEAFLGAIYADQSALPAHGYAPLPPTVLNIAQAGYGASATPPNPQPLTC